jgi:RNA polymerase sigma-70 factor (ECF subfamily)
VINTPGITLDVLNTFFISTVQSSFLHNFLPFFCQILPAFTFTSLKKARVSNSNMEEFALKDVHILEKLTHRMQGQVPIAPLLAPEAFSSLYERAYLSVFRYLFGLHGGPQEEVEDLTAETFARAWKARRSFSGDPQTAAIGWLLRIARRLVIDGYRHGRAHVQAGEDGLPEDLPQPGPTPEALLLMGEKYETLWNLLRTLPARQREMLVLRYLLDWRVGQIGGYLEIPENTVSVNLHRALARLQEEWPDGKE